MKNHQKTKSSKKISKKFSTDSSSSATQGPFEKPKASDLSRAARLPLDQQWFVFREERHFGPLSTDQINDFLSLKYLSAHHRVWRPSFSAWKPLVEVEGFKAEETSDLISDEDFANLTDAENFDPLDLAKSALGKEKPARGGLWKKLSSICKQASK